MAMFVDRVQARISTKGSPICLGIDPHFDHLPDFMERTCKDSGFYGLLSQFSATLIDVAADYFPAVKFQSAFYEAHGWEGFKALQESVAYAKSRGLLVILDAKRGDIASTMKAYGTMAFAKMGADCLTVTPYMGTDVIKPLAPWLREGNGVYLVWLGSNTKPEDFFFWRDEKSGTRVGEGILDDILRYLDKEGLQGSAGLVLGATMLTALSDRLLQKASRLPLLLPGVGSQGGEINKNFKEQVVSSGRHLIPLSRGVAGLGDALAARSLDAIPSWEGYANYVRGRCQSDLI